MGGGSGGAADRETGGAAAAPGGPVRGLFRFVDAISRKSGSFPCILFALSCLATLAIQFASRPDAVLPKAALADSVSHPGAGGSLDPASGQAVPPADSSRGEVGGPVSAASPDSASVKASVDAFVGEVEWRSKFLLETVIAIFAFLLAVHVVWTSLRSGWETRKRSLGILLLLGGILLIVDFTIILSMKGEGWAAALTGWLRETCSILPGHEGFLSRLLATLPEGSRDVRLGAVWGRLAGEPVGFCIGIAMYAAAILPAHVPTQELAGRSRTLNHLLYAASLLFVAGLLMSGANFSWILDHWEVPLKAADRDALIEKGVELAGVAYSAILAVFFLPTRTLLEARVRAAMDGRPADLEAQEKWRKENGFNGGWKEDVRQILAILAPVITAPLFKAMVE